MPSVTKGRDGKKLWCAPVNVLGSDCVYRSCFRAHDCGYSKRCYTGGRWTHNEWVRRGECVTRFSHGCPESFTIRACCDNPSFRTKGEAASRKCRNCRALVPERIIEQVGQEVSFREMARSCAELEREEEPDVVRGE